MATTFNDLQLKQIKQVVKDVLDEEMPQRLDHIENKIDKVLKIVTTTHDELLLTQAKVDRHDKEIKQFESFVGFATT